MGPRLVIQLIKIEDGLCSGEVLYHEFSKYEHLFSQKCSKISLPFDFSMNIFVLSTFIFSCPRFPFTSSFCSEF